MKVTPITEYHRVTFKDAKTAQAASAAMMNYATSPAALLQLTGPNRIVMWEESAAIDIKTIYLSPGAIAILKKKIALPAAETVPPTSLPQSRVLMVGDDSDWDATGSGRPSPLGSGSV
jgi:hypothetical protein